MRAADRARIRRIISVCMADDRALRPHQRAMVSAASASPLVAMLGARQIGKTTAAGFWAACLAAGFSPLGHDVEPNNVQIISATEKLAQEFVGKARAFLTATFGVGVPQETRRERSALDSRYGSLASITLSNGRRIVAHAGNPDAIQGLSGHVFWDEAGASRDPTGVYAQALAVTSGAPGRRLWICGNASLESRPSRRDWWYDLWHSKLDEMRAARSMFDMHTFTIERCYPDGLPPHLVAIRTALGGPNSVDWRRWYMCEFAASFDRALDDVQITRMRITPPMLSAGAPIIIGVDPGGHPNPTGVVVARVGDLGLDVLQAEYWRGPVVAGDERTRESWTMTQVSRILQLVHTYGAIKVIVDKSAINNHLADALALRLGSMLDPRPTTTDIRQRRWAALRDCAADGRISIPSTATDLLDDLARLELDTARVYAGKAQEAGILVLPQVPLGDYVLHCDVADALLLCCEYVTTQAGDGPSPSRHAPRVDYGPRLRTH